MRETQRNIRTYKKKLIGLKEKLATAGLLFLMSAVMLTTASFAWITLSVAPEVKGIATTVAGNGNLEIALVSTNEDGTAKLPEVSQVGDSNKNIVEKNITWGNLVNLNDNSYGLNKVVLRPATLNTSSTLDSPLRAVEYDKDGRINAMNYEFSYSNYSSGEDKFVISNQTSYGVRAISSVIITASGEDAERNVEMRNSIIASLETAKSTYIGLVTNQNYLKSIADLMGKFLEDKLLDSNSNIKGYLPTFYKMMEEFELAVNQLGETYLEIANVQITKKNLSLDSYTSLDQLFAETESSLARKGITLMSGFNKLKSIKQNLPVHMANIKNSMSKDSVLMTEIQSDINYLVTINTCKIDGDFTIAEMGNKSLGELAGMLSGTHKGEIQGGALRDFEQLTGAKMDAKNMKIKASVATVTANISTTAEEPFTVPTLIEGDGTSSKNGTEYTSIVALIFGNSQMIETAADVYGMSIDLWLRTNIEDSYLILEGNPKLVYEVQRTASNYIIYENEDGRQFYHIPDKDYPAPNPNSINPMSKIIYKDGDDKVIVDHYLNYGTFYGVATNQPVTFTQPDEEDTNGISDTRELFVSGLKYSPKTVVTGYDGVNRIWEESADLVEGTSTTQGKGSCFIFYPEDPLEQERMLKVLSALSVAFIDDTGGILARATLNPEHAYEEVGKVTIPLELTAESNYYVDGLEEIHYITQLAHNESMFISAIVYIDGELVSNEDVNATSNVNGFLNLQFGSSQELMSLVDEDLKAQYVKATATVSDNFFEVTEIPATTTVSLEIDGINTVNKNVQMNFVRKINEYQGVQLDPISMTLTSSTEDSSSLIGTQVFNNPGVYILSSVWVDGIEYDLEQKISVEVEGFKINSINWASTGDDVLSGNDVYKMTSDNNYNIQLTVDVAASEQFRPTKMSALFRNEYNEYVTINLSENAGKWIGIGDFITSGKYELQYLYINDDIYYVDEAYKKTITLVLGIYSSVDLEYRSIDSETNEEIIQSGSNIQFEWDSTDLSKNVVDIKTVKICDNKGNVIEGLDGVKLYYSLTGSTNKNLYAELVWNASVGAYTGKPSSDNAAQQFLISTPGVYRFDRVFIADTSNEDANVGSEIRKAAYSTVITATSPYPIEFFEETLNVKEHQFAPIQNAAFTVDMKYSSAASVMAKMTYYGDSKDNKGVTYYVPGIPTENSTDPFVSTWSFTPFINADQNGSEYPIGVDGKISQYSEQDGIWVLEDIRLVNVYAIDEEKTEETGEEQYKWYGIPRDNWWIPEKEEDENNYVTWDVADKTTNILGKIYVSASATDKMDSRLEAVFTTSLSGTYTINDYNITYTDSISRTVNNEFLKIFGLQIESNSVTYTYDTSSADAILNDSTGWLDKIGTNDPGSVISDPGSVISAYKTTVENTIITFADTVSITFKYPGTYTPMLSISVVEIDSNGNKIRNLDSSKESKELKVTNNLKSHTVSWLRPDVKFIAVDPSTSFPAKYQTGRGLFGIPRYEETTATNARTDYSIDVYFKNNQSTLDDALASAATTELSNAGSLFSTATCTIVNSQTGTANSYMSYTASNVVFEYSKDSLQSTKDIGEDSIQNLYSTRKGIGANSRATYVLITYNEVDYIFTLENPLVVNANNGGGY